MADAVWIEAWLLGVIIMLLVLYALFDVAYFFRMTLTVIVARYYKRKKCIMDKIPFKSWCFLNDIDTLLYHMNNARYLRELDFARVDFYERTGLYAFVRDEGGSVVQAATTIRYRRFIKPCNLFTITSKVVFWDEKTIFMEHEFVSNDGFVNAVAICRQRIISSSASAVMEKLSRLHCDDNCRRFESKSPVMPPEILAWVESNDISSQKLRAAAEPNAEHKSDETTRNPNSDDKPNGHFNRTENSVSQRKNVTVDQSNDNVSSAGTSVITDRSHRKGS